MKYLIALASAALLISGLASGDARAADPFVIGVIAPTSGPMATVGIRELNGMQWWQRDVNAKGGIKDRRVELATCDDQGNPERAVTCTRDLVGRGVVMLLNSTVAGAIRATLPLLENGPVMLIASPAIVPAPSTFIFQITPTDADLTRSLLAYVKANGVTRLAMIAATDASGEVGVADARAVFPPAGIELALARIDLRANDASIQLSDITQGNPQLIYSSYSGAGAATIVKSYANLGLSVPLVISNGNVTDSFIAVIKNDLPPRLLGMGMRSMVPEFVTDPEERARLEYFAKSYEEWQKEPMNQLSQQGLLLADRADAVLRNVDDPTDAKAVRAYLETHDVKSILTEHFSKDSHVGLGPGGILPLDYKDGHWTKAAPLPKTSP